MTTGKRNTMSRALWLQERHKAELRDAPLGPLMPEHVLIESRFGAISRGTEALIAEGGVPEAEYDRMRAPLQEGNFPFPVKYGYAVVGEVIAGPEAIVGKTVFCLHPHQDLFHAPSAMVFAVPQQVPAARAVLAANMETALNAIWDAGIMAGDKVAIIGGGLVGLLVAYLSARIPGTRVTVVDLQPGRRRPVEAFGCDFAMPADTDALTGSMDVVIHASASPGGLATAIALAGFEARIVEMSWYGEARVEVALGGAFHSQRLSIVASQVGNLPAARRARWSAARRLEMALQLLDDDRLDLLISGETAFADLAARYSKILADTDTLCHRILYR